MWQAAIEEVAAEELPATRSPIEQQVTQELPATRISVATKVQRLLPEGVSGPMGEAAVEAKY